MKKATLIKRENHFHIVDESTITVRNWFIEFDLKGTRSSYCNKPYFCDIGNTGNFILTKNNGNFPFPENCKKITHSTQVLEGVILIDLSDVEEVVYGYSTEKIVKNLIGIPDEHLYSIDHSSIEFGIKCIEAYQKLNRFKHFTIRDMKKCWEQAEESATGTDDFPMAGNTFRYPKFKDFIKPLLPKTEWDIEIIEGKIRLL